MQFQTTARTHPLPFSFDGAGTSISRCPCCYKLFTVHSDCSLALQCLLSSQDFPKAPKPLQTATQKHPTGCPSPPHAPQDAPKNAKGIPPPPKVPPTALSYPHGSPKIRPRPFETVDSTATMKFGVAVLNAPQWF